MEPSEYQFVYSDASAPNRLDQYIASEIQSLTRSGAQRLIKLDKVSVNGISEKPNYQLKNGDLIKVQVPPQPIPELVPEDIPLDILYEDTDLLVINKPRGMTVHPAPGHQSGTLVNAVLWRSTKLSKVAGEQRPGIVHRLDKDTSGLLVIAKSDLAYSGISKQFQNKTAHRSYYVLVWGEAPFEEAEVDAPIGRHPKYRQKMAVIKEPEKHTSRNAFTKLKVVERFKGITLLQATLKTGRTHQIRVHLSFIGLPVLGDPLYCSQKKTLPKYYTKNEHKDFQSLVDRVGGQALHAFKLDFIHPITNLPMSLESSMPDDMAAIIDWLRKHH